VPSAVFAGSVISRNDPRPAARASSAIVSSEYGVNA